MTPAILNDISPGLINSVAPHPLQSWEWGEARKKMGIDVLRIGEFDNDVLKNIFQVTFHKVPRTHFTIGYLPKSNIPYDATIELLQEESKKRNTIFIKVEPNILKGTAVIPKKLQPAKHSLFPSWTQQLDLKKSEEELLRDMKPKTRYNIRLAEKKGVTVKEMTNEKGFDMFIKLYFETTARQKYHGHTRGYHKIIFETLQNNISHIFIAFYKDIPLSAYHIFNFNNVLYYPYGGSSPEYKNLMASNLLMWEVIRFGKLQGCTLFDMWGSLPPDYDPSSPWSGFTRFKEGFGAKFVEYAGSFDIVNNPFVYSAFNLAQSVRKKYLL